MDRVQIGKIIVAGRKREGLDQQTLADLARISARTLSDIERGTGNPTLDSLLKIATTLGLKLSLQ